MTPEQAARLRAGLLALAPAERFAARFYEVLFALDPAARRLFSGPIDAQAAKFADMISSLAATLDDPARASAMVAELGRRHAGYGVAEHHYDAVGAALLQALRQAHGPDWDEALEDAWASFYGELAEGMIAAAPHAR